MEQNKSRTYIHNPFEKKECPKCGHKYDALQPACPKCQEPFETERAVPFNKVTFTNPWIEIALFLTGWLGLRLVVSIVGKILSELINNGTLVMTNLEANSALNFIVYGTLFPIVLGIAVLYLPKISKSFAKPEMLWGIMVFIVVLGFNIVWGTITKDIGANTNDNQERVNDLAKMNLPLSLLFLGVIGPIVEEFTYRVGLFNFTRRINRVLGYVVSALVFGLIHMSFDATSDPLSEWLSYPIYVFAGLSFAFAYEKWGLGASALAHITNNVFSLLLVYYQQAQ
ncbi:MAG: CPBP family intramembrane metalloprotease [Bacilli bacterium]|nr:CPBP family intramembrane metalloprotease [Bacilli bacterium]